MNKELKKYNDKELQDLLNRVNKVMNVKHQMTLQDLRNELFYCEDGDWLNYPYFWVDWERTQSGGSLKFQLEWEK